ncbi:hypothetical protein ANCCAN_29092 [Ancylostoma caninum]|uniref:Uncharacterized protein n=1 Tax=Ancylostoma caninum TaxID=29170 RepID=A0A368F4R6_ANCCA|nr:hypothetical protein ANCCAN_29092 [Ancylostoma caninum]
MLAHRSKGNDTQSVASSIEFHDAIIDETFTEGQKARMEKEIFESQSKGGLVQRWFHYFTDRALLKRLVSVN